MDDEFFIACYHFKLFSFSHFRYGAANGIKSSDAIQKFQIISDTMGYFVTQAQMNEKKKPKAPGDLQKCENLIKRFLADIHNECV